jgi:hypothetical protein
VKGLVVVRWSARFQKIRSAGVVEAVPDGMASRLLAREELP